MNVAMTPARSAVPGAFDELMDVRGAPAPAGEVTISGADPFYRTPFRVAETVGAVLAATGVAASDIWEMRTGRRQKVSIDVGHAAATVRTVDYTRRRDPDGVYRHIPIPDAMVHMVAITQPWKTRDGLWYLPHLNLPHLAARVLGVLKCESTPAGVSAAVAQWNARDLEEAIAAAGACGGTIRTAEEWLAHPQGKLLAERPVIEIIKLADGPPEPFRPGPRPLSGIRMLDLTRILAGPLAGRACAEQGADVLMVTAPDLPQTPEHVRDTSHGKRSCFLDLRKPEDAARMASLVREVDIFTDGYRPGRLAAHGFGLDQLLALRPGLIHLDISCYGVGGPFSERPGWEQVAQCVSGLAHAHGMATAGQPKLIFAPVCDYTTGYLAGLGVMLALARRAREGGSYSVRVSLCQSAMLVLRQGMLADWSAAPEGLDEATLAGLHVREDNSYGDLKTLGPVLRMSETTPRWDRVTPKLGGDVAEWLPFAA